MKTLDELTEGELAFVLRLSGARRGDYDELRRAAGVKDEDALPEYFFRSVDQILKLTKDP